MHGAGMNESVGGALKICEKAGNDDDDDDGKVIEKGEKESCMEGRK